MVQCHFCLNSKKSLSSKHWRNPFESEIRTCSDNLEHDLNTVENINHIWKEMVKSKVNSALTSVLLRILMHYQEISKFVGACVGSDVNGLMLKVDGTRFAADLIYLRLLLVAGLLTQYINQMLKWKLYGWIPLLYGKQSSFKLYCQRLFCDVYNILMPTWWHRLVLRRCQKQSASWDAWRPCIAASGLLLAELL